MASSNTPTQIQVLIWGVYFAGAYISTYFFGLPGRIAYLVIVGAIVLAFNRQISIALTHLTAKMGWMKATIDRMPNTIALARAAGPDEAALPVAAELSKAGFTHAGAWDIPPMPKIKLALMVHRDENFLAAIETATAIGAQVNIHTLYDDNKVASFTNSRMPSPPLRPEVTYTREPGLAPTALFEKARRERRRNGIRNISVEEAPRIYEKLYADAIKYRKAKGA
jgi:hypothetical protein